MRTLWLPLLISALLTACNGGRLAATTPATDGSNTDPTDSDNPAELCNRTQISPERLLLQQVGSDRAIIKWRGGEGDDVVCFGTNPAALPKSSETIANITETNHREALLTELEADTTYYYSVGGSGSTDELFQFRTAPVTGDVPSDGNTRIWILGDPGHDSLEQAAVRDAFYDWVDNTGGEPADIALFLGDNAYLDGTDSQYQQRFFNYYPELLRTTGTWSCIGNHEMGTSGVSIQSDPNTYFPISEPGAIDAPPNSPLPYLNIFSFPTLGENGGVPSGTEQYYSFDYGNVHVVSLDSQLTARDAAQRDAMADWVTADLAANNSDWTLVIFHHPPYSKGSHDSDSGPENLIDKPQIDMREQFNPIFEQYGVDLVYTGHSHVYERSYYLHNLTGTSDTFDPQVHVELNDAGEPASGQGDEIYTQVTRSGADDKVVYTTAGSSGTSTAAPAEGYPHPANYFSDLGAGSVVIDANQVLMTVTFIRDTGDVLDTFSIAR